MEQEKIFKSKTGQIENQSNFRRKNMALIPYRGGWDIDRWFDDDDWMNWPSFQLMKMPEAPKMDVYEKDGKVMVKAELPGFKREQIDAQIKDGVLTIEAKSEEKKEEDDKKKGYWRKEIRHGYVKRAIALPEIDESGVEAEFENGVLKITAPKAAPQVEEAKSKKLEIKGK